MPKKREPNPMQSIADKLIDLCDLINSNIAEGAKLR
jgi:hypothetical protein